MARELVCSQKRGWISEGHTCERGGGACATASARCGKKLSLAVGGGRNVSGFLAASLFCGPGLPCRRRAPGGFIGRGERGSRELRAGGSR